jgi:hypothetical protein
MSNSLQQKASQFTSLKIHRRIGQFGFYNASMNLALLSSENGTISVTICVYILGRSHSDARTMGAYRLSLRRPIYTSMLRFIRGNLS